MELLYFISIFIIVIISIFLIKNKKNKYVFAIVMYYPNPIFHYDESKIIKIAASETGAILYLKSNHPNIIKKENKWMHKHTKKVYFTIKKIFIIN